MYQTTWKLLAIAAIMVVLVGQQPVAMAESVDSNYSSCITETVDYLSKAQIDDSVKVLMSESRKFYPDVRDLMKASVSQEYIESISKLGNPRGCEKLDAYYKKISSEVPCHKGLGNDDRFNEEVMESKQKARDFYEALFLCQLTDGHTGLAY